MITNYKLQITNYKLGYKVYKVDRVYRIILLRIFVYKNFINLINFYKLYKQNILTTNN